MGIFGLLKLASCFLFIILIHSSSLLFAEREASGEKSCLSAIAQIELARVKSEFRLSQAIHSHQLAKFAKGPLHLSTHISTEWMWVTHPHSGSEYYSVRKGDTGFMFSGPVTNRFDLIDSSNIVLRSIDVSSNGNPYFLGTFVVEQEGQKHVIFRSITMKNPETGELQMGDNAGIQVGQARDTVDDFVVTARPISSELSEYWVTDGSSKILIVQMDKEGNVFEGARIDLGADELDGVNKIVFRPDGQEAIVRFKSKSGDEYLAVLTIQENLMQAEGESNDQSLEVADEAESDEYELEIGIDPESIVQIPTGSRRMSMHPLKNFIAISYEGGIEIYGQLNKGGKLEKIYSISSSELAPGRIFRGADFYISGDLVHFERDGVAMQGYGNLRANLAVISQDEDGQKSFVDWREMGGSK